MNYLGNDPLRKLQEFIGGEGGKKSDGFNQSPSASDSFSPNSQLAAHVTAANETAGIIVPGEDRF